MNPSMGSTIEKWRPARGEGGARIGRRNGDHRAVRPRGRVEYGTTVSKKSGAIHMS